ncbi:hypothetical protein BDQ17DRAFT_1399878 [Cyathus striatus]|nr:hypothetical protein BDQ17DRAFT_1399878 [Cyathus striatus]
MKIIQFFSQLFAFRTLPTTILAFISYLAIFIAIFITDQLPAVPKNQRGVSLNRAYEDLHHIASRPHPYNSHANDAVRSYILSRLSPLAQTYPYIELADDLVSNGSWAGAYGVYFEGTNILLKILGTEEQYANEGGVLLSAHYDSVSTAPGATDDGMGVASLIQLSEYFAKNRPKRTVVVNINNGEEDWLNGAHAFLQHPWSNIPNTFLNLEGASSGGRPLLFRVTSPAPLTAFLPKHVPHPHANVLSSDAFARGVIRSGTDFSVYAERKMQGLDLAFYKGRSRYHTKYDAIPYTEGQERSLWAMMEAALGAARALADAGEEKKGAAASVYFDLFAATLIILSLPTLQTLNIITLVLGPIVLILLTVITHIASRESPHPHNGAPHRTGSVLRDTWEWFRDGGWLRGVWVRAKFWVALVVACGTLVGLVVGFVQLNPFIVYSHPYWVLLSTFSLSLLSISLVLNLPILPHGLVLPEQQKQATLLQTYIFTWMLLVGATIGVGRGLGGGYWVTIWHILVFIACVLGWTEEMLKAHGTRSQQVDDIRIPGALDEDADESTPLIRHRAREVERIKEEGEEEGAVGWWILQFLLVVPIPVILMGHIANMLLDAMCQTLADGGSPGSVYAAAALLGLLLAIPLAPFSFKFHYGFMAFLALVCVCTTAYLWLVFPFSIGMPLKVFFQQRVELPSFSSSSLSKDVAPEKVVTALTGALFYLRMIVPRIPSSKGKKVDCFPEKMKLGLYTCEWESGALPSPGSWNSSFDGESIINTSLLTPSNPWLESTISRTSSGARISLRGTNTRSCRIYSSPERKITKYTVHGSAGMQDGYDVPSNGVDNVRLWGREWGRGWVVDVESAGDNNGEGEVEGKVACEWAEYESGSVDHGMVDDGFVSGAESGSGSGGEGGKIPALEEVLTFLPEWAVVSKSADGLVEVVSSFKL